MRVIETAHLPIFKSDGEEWIDMEKQNLNYETYQITLQHYIVCDEEYIRLEEPLVVKMIVSNDIPAPVCLNRMIDMMRDEMLKRNERIVL